MFKPTHKTQYILSAIISK